MITAQRFGKHAEELPKICRCHEICTELQGTLLRTK